MNVLIANPIEDAVERCMAFPGYRVGIIVSAKEEKYSVEDAVGKAVFSAYLKKTGGEHQFTRFYKKERGFECEFIDEGSVIDCILLNDGDNIRGRRYNMLISAGEFDERAKTMMCLYNTHKPTLSKNKDSDDDNKSVMIALDNLSNIVAEMYNVVKQALEDKD